VTPEKMENEIISLCEQVLHLQQKQEEQTKQWLRLCNIGAGIGIALFVADAYMQGAFSMPFGRHYGGPPYRAAMS